VQNLDLYIAITRQVVKIDPGRLNYRVNDALSRGGQGSASRLGLVAQKLTHGNYLELPVPEALEQAQLLGDR
jgi:hypothetical protein